MWVWGSFQTFHSRLNAFLFINVQFLFPSRQPPALIHQFYFGLSFVHNTPKAFRVATELSAQECVVVWYPTTYFFFFVFHTLVRFCSLAASSMLFLIVNVFIIIFFNSFCNLLWRRVHADFFPTVTIFRIKKYFFFFPLAERGEKKFRFHWEVTLRAKRERN